MKWIHKTGLWLGATAITAAMAFAAGQQDAAQIERPSNLDLAAPRATTSEKFKQKLSMRKAGQKS
jgi:biotin carboxylase